MRSHRRRLPVRSWPVAALSAVIVLAPSCADDSGSASPPTTTTSAASASSTTSTTTPTTSTTTTTTVPAPAAARPHEVVTTQLTLVDPSRPTAALNGSPGSDDRTIEVWLTLPETDEPAPLIVFSHGLSGHPRKFTELHTRWAEAGYAVAAPVFPLTNSDAERSFANSADIQNQPEDVSFVLDELLAASADPAADLAGRFDPDHIGASGLSAGGFTTYAVAVNELGRDPRFRAAAVMAGLVPTDSESFVAADLPVLVMHGDADPLIGVAEAESAYDALVAPRYLVVLHGGGHAAPFENGDAALEARVPGHEEIVAETTLAFWDRYLLGIDEAGAELIESAAVDGLTTLEADPG